MMAKEHIPLSVGLRARAQADGQSREGAPDVPELATKGDDARGAHLFHFVAGGIHDGR